MATWSKGQPWRVVRSLDRLNTQIRAAYPRAVPPATPAASWGAIADSAHSSTSDHYPHYYSTLGSTAVVCARDFPHAPVLGLDAHALAERLRLSRDPRIGYIISNRRITGPQHGWRWDPYSGSDPHDTHIHVSTVHTTAADDTRDWQIGQQAAKEDDVSAEDVWDGTKWVGNDGKTAYTAGSWLRNANKYAAQAKEEATKARLTGEAVLAAVKGLDTKAVLARINEVATAEAARDQAAAAERAELAELVRQGQAGELDAAEVVRLIGERLTAAQAG